MYVCMYTYILPVSHVSARLCTCTSTYTRMTYERIRICVLRFMCYACIGPAMRATRTYIHTYNVAAHCATVGTTPSLLGHDESARTNVCAYVLLGFTCLACVGLAMRATRAYIHTNDVAAHCATIARRHHYLCAMTQSTQNC